jgi:hypothetical protein
MYQQREKAPPKWEIVKTFSKTVGRTELAAEIKRDMAVPYPKFSYSVGRQGQDRVVPYLSLESHRDDQGNREYVFLSDVIGDLAEQAENWIAEETKKMDDAFAERRRSTYQEELPPAPRPSFDDSRKRSRGNGSRRGRDFDEDRDY